MEKRLSMLLLVLVLSLALAACGGGGDDDGDPTQVVKDLFKAIEEKKFDTITDFACAAQKDEVAADFDVGAAITDDIGAEVDPQKVLDAITFKVSNLEVEEVSKSGDKATVHAKARLDFEVDPEKFKEIVVELLKAQGLEDIPDSMIDPIIEQTIPQIETQGQEFDETFGVVKEEGQWLICED